MHFPQNLDKRPQHKYKSKVAPDLQHGINMLKTLPLVNTLSAPQQSHTMGTERRKQLMLMGTVDRLKKKKKKVLHCV